mgnify:CR=1 FL=1|jgi:nucleoside-diphosphate-sugar epimerase
MNIVIYGGKGWIGQQFIDILKKRGICHIISETRVNNYDDVYNDLIEYNPTHVISFIGRTHGTYNDKYFSTIDYLEQPGTLVENINDNLYGPLIIAEACKRYSKFHRPVHYTYMGTGCIFEYDNEHPFEKEENGFKEKDIPNFTGSSYSIVKGTTDKLMNILYPIHCLNIRIRMPITNIDNSRNFITKITNYEKICSVKNSMTVLPELLPHLVDLMKKQIVGTINFTNPGLISHNEILEMYKNIVDTNFIWKNFTLEEQSDILDSGRSNNYLDTSKLKILCPGVKNIKDSIRDILENYKK